MLKIWSYAWFMYYKHRNTVMDNYFSFQMGKSQIILFKIQIKNNLIVFLGYDADRFNSFILFIQNRCCNLRFNQTWAIAVVIVINYNLLHFFK